MKVAKLLVIMMTCLLFSSCDMVERSFNPLVDYVVVQKNTEDIYARNDAYAADTMCVDTALVASFRLKQNISSKWQYVLAKPKVEWQRNHSEWLSSKSARSMRWILFRLLFIVALIGFWIPQFADKIRERIHTRKLDKLVAKAEKAEEKGKLEEADRLYAQCEELGPTPFKKEAAEYFTSRLMPYTLLLMLLIEGLYIFMFNFNMPMLSPGRVGFASALINAVLLIASLLSQILIVMLYSNYLAHANNSTSSLWRLPLKWAMILAIPVVILLNTFVMPFDIIIMVLGIICCAYILIKNKQVKLIDAKIFALCMLFTYIFMYMVAYTYLVILTVGAIVVGLFFGLKAVGASVDMSVDSQKIKDYQRSHPGITHEEASRAYYAQKREELRKEMEKQKVEYK